MCLCDDAYGSLLALATTDQHVRLINPLRLSSAAVGQAASTAASFRLKDDDGALLSLSALGGASNASSSGFGSASSVAPPHSPLLLYTTESGHAVAVDPRKGGEVEADARAAAWADASLRGDTNGNWLLLGSSTGHCVLWDLRYAIRLHSWQCPGGPRIRSMLHVRPHGAARPTVLLAGMTTTGAAGRLATRATRAARSSCSRTARPTPPPPPPPPPRCPRDHPADGGGGAGARPLPAFATRCAPCWPLSTARPS